MESQKIIENAKALAQSIKRDAQMVASAEIEDLKQELRCQIIETAAMFTKETLVKVFNEKDQKQSTEDFFRQLKFQVKSQVKSQVKTQEGVN